MPHADGVFLKEPMQTLALSGKLANEKFARIQAEADLDANRQPKTPDTAELDAMREELGKYKKASLYPDAEWKPLSVEAAVQKYYH